MAVINDEEFGDIVLRRSKKSTGIKFSTAPNGTLRASAPAYVPLFMVKRVIASSRSELRKLQDLRPALKLSNGMSVGKSHSLHIRPGQTLAISRTGQQLILTIPHSLNLASAPVIELARKHIIDALRREAKHYLPKRLAYIANQGAFSYSKVRFSHSSSRWGSCSQLKVISLNIALMNLPFELIDYVIVHELAHTKELNHSKQFWNIVETACPEFRLYRKTLKSHSPSI